MPQRTYNYADESSKISIIVGLFVLLQYKFCFFCFFHQNYPCIAAFTVTKITSRYDLHDNLIHQIILTLRLKFTSSQHSLKL
jgi:hypothetical protein